MLVWFDGVVLLGSMRISRGARAARNSARDASGEVVLNRPSRGGDLAV